MWGVESCVLFTYVCVMSFIEAGFLELGITHTPFDYWLMFVAMFVTGFWASKVAKRNGRNAYLYLLNGIIFGLFGVLAAYVNGKSEQRKIQEEAKRQADIIRLTKEYIKEDEG